MLNSITASLHEAKVALDALINNPAALKAIESAATLLIRTINNKGRVFSCGNGGSMCDAMHFAEELSGRYRLDRKALPAASISDPSHLSCVSNDYGYEHVFSRYLEAHASKEDCLLALSTSGKSKNIITAASYARSHGIKVICLTGRAGSELSAFADIEICTPAGTYADRVQELHIKVIHILIESIERALFPQNYADEDK
jgi:D-sedoheptulose 7-phosphate isomerase